MPVLTIRHVAKSIPPQFLVLHEGGECAGPFHVTSPICFPVAGRPNSNLGRELRWYLEEFIKYPFSPETEHAENVLDALQSWGEAAFGNLFGDKASGGLFERATQDGYHELLLRLISDDPTIQTWPWEALRDPRADYLAHACRVERCLSTIKNPMPLDPNLPYDRVHILLVTARPMEGDVDYKSISGPLVELLDTEQLPADIHLLRPPTFETLQRHLRERPGYYHIVHFDGHGVFGVVRSESIAADKHTFSGPQGQLVFEDADGKPDPKTAEQLGPLLREYKIPCMILNACLVVLT